MKENLANEIVGVIADIHHRTALADRAIDAATEVGATRFVFLGDFFDDLGDSYLDAERTARWLRARIERHPEDTFLFGNHDLPHAFGGMTLYPCPGWTPKKHHAVNRVLEERHWRHLRLHTWEEGWLLSHAGIARWLFPFTDGDTPKHKRFVIDERCRLALERSWRGEQDLLLSVAGKARGGRAETGGIVWQCWSEFEPIRDVPQIVGHTPAQAPRWRQRLLLVPQTESSLFVRGQENHDAPVVSRNACLDTHMQHYGLLQNGQLTIHPTPGTDAFHQTLVVPTTASP